TPRDKGDGGRRQAGDGHHRDPERARHWLADRLGQERLRHQGQRDPAVRRRPDPARPPARPLWPGDEGCTRSATALHHLRHQLHVAQGSIATSARHQRLDVAGGRPGQAADARASRRRSARASGQGTPDRRRLGPDALAPGRGAGRVDLHTFPGGRGLLADRDLHELRPLRAAQRHRGRGARPLLALDRRVHVPHPRDGPTLQRADPYLQRPDARSPRASPAIAMGARTCWRLLLLGLLTSGCATGLGPKAVRGERPDYNKQIVRSADAEKLLNVVRLRYNDTPLFLELGGVVAQYSYDASLTAAGQIISGPGPNSASVGTGLGYSEKPTITYTPLSGEEFATRMLAPIPLDSVMLFAQSGWSLERLFLVTVQRVNEVFNAPTASGPTPAGAPDYKAFADLAERLQRLESARLIGLNWEKAENEKQPPGRNPRFWLRRPPDAPSVLADDLAAVRRYLDLEPGRNDFTLTAFPFDRQPTEVGVRCRSLLGVLYFLSQAVDPPASA